MKDTTEVSTSGAQHHSHYRYKRHSSHEEAALIQQMTANIKERQNVFFDMEAYLPKKNGYEPSDILLQAPHALLGCESPRTGENRTWWGGTLVPVLPILGGAAVLPLWLGVMSPRATLLSWHLVPACGIWGRRKVFSLRRTNM